MLAPRGVLYVVATPLGNLEDITLRAVRILQEVALIACEDTRRTAHLLQAHDISTPTTSYFEHNEKWKGERILDVVRGGRVAALVSDAGTPGISDPGFRLVRDARAEGLAVVPVPGPSAVVAALSVSGLPSDRFLFVGFLPPRAGRARQGARRPGRRSARRSSSTSRRCGWWRPSPTCSRSSATARSSSAARRPSSTRSTCADRSRHPARLLAARPEVKGEIVLVVSGAGEPPPASADEVAATYAALVAAGRTRREAVKETARRHSLPAREVYAQVLKDEAGRQLSAAGSRGRGRAPRDPPSATGAAAPASSGRAARRSRPGARAAAPASPPPSSFTAMSAAAGAASTAAR